MSAGDGQPTYGALTSACYPGVIEKLHSGLGFRGYLRVPQEGVYHFTLESPTNARLFIRNLERDLELPPVVSANYRNHVGRGSIALKAGYHRIEIQYLQAWKNPNLLDITIQGPGRAPGPIPNSWLFRE